MHNRIRVWKKEAATHYILPSYHHGRSVGKAALELTVAILIAFALIVLLTSPVRAAVKPSKIEILDVQINRNLVESGDFLLIAHYNIVVSSVPDEGVDETHTFRLINTDGVTELGAALAYPYNDKGYGHGVISLYFTAADAPTWGQDYVLRVSGNPAIYENPKVQNYQLTGADYTSLTGQEDNQQQITDWVIDVAETLELEWTATLLQAADMGTVLASAGETYFRNAIYGLQVMAPQLFYVQVATNEYAEREWGTNQATTYRDRFNGTWVGNSIEDVAEDLGVDKQMISGIFIFIGVVGVMAGSVMAWHTANPGMIGALLLVLMGGVMGFVSMAIIAILAIFIVLYIGYFWFFQRA